MSLLVSKGMIIGITDWTIYQLGIAYRYILEAPKFVCVYYSGSMAALLYQIGSKGVEGLRIERGIV